MKESDITRFSFGKNYPRDSKKLLTKDLLISIKTALEDHIGFFIT